MDPFKLITNGIPGIQHIVIELEQSVTVTNTNSTSSTTAEGNATERQDADLSRAVSDGANTTAESCAKEKQLVLEQPVTVPAVLLVLEAMQQSVSNLVFYAQSTTAVISG